MMTLRVLAASAALVAGMFAGTPATRGAVDTMYLGGNPSVSGGSCADPDFSTTGGYDAAMASALAAIDADGDTIVMCNGTYTTTTTNSITVEHDFNIRAETRRGATVGGSDSFLDICAPNVTVTGVRIVDMEDDAVVAPCDDTVNVSFIDVEVSSSGALAWYTGGEFSQSGVLQIVDSHIHDNSDEAIVLWGSVQVTNSVIERNFSIVGILAPIKLSIISSRLERNGGLWVSVGAASCLSVEKSIVKDNGEVEGIPIPLYTLYAFNFDEDWSCPTKVTNTRFEGNTAFGGALTLSEPAASTLVKGNLFMGNRGEIAGAVVVCSEAPSRKLEALTKRIGFFKINRYRDNEAPDRRNNNVRFFVGECGFIG